MFSGKSTRLARTALCATLAASLGFGQAARAASDCTVDAMLVFDGSGSMAGMSIGRIGESRITRARQAVRAAAPDIAAFRRVGMMIYGPGSGDRCTNVTLNFPPRIDAAPQILSTIDTLAPRGETPLTSAVQQAAEILEYRRKPGVVVLVTDGRENCGGSPCALASALKSDAVDLTVHVIGFETRPPERAPSTTGAPVRKRSAPALSGESADCMAEITGGSYVVAESVSALTEALSATLGCPVYGAVPRARHAG
ncbi:VWA domain-containing protein [Thalassococcus sp. CAU 1522]|uniref:VWA domain-containing protein n=1 Tax=Thalassococcus arenae TaxID=2851652 RepID=A0ABS6N9N1_9RHOB|nr:VWA domain-containing protein [Thalassococcus arenae]MBV2360721.1 VWA domain-containing protein [Thalassococcus arenae]